MSDLGEVGRIMRDKLEHEDEFRRLWLSGVPMPEIRRVMFEQRYPNEPDRWPSIHTMNGWRRRLGLPLRKVVEDPNDKDAFLPFRILMRHSGAHDAIMVRALRQEHYGRKPLGPVTAQRLEAWKTERRRLNQVVAYFPDTPQGWFYLERDPEIDAPNDFIRRPRR